ncbi:MAG: flagellar basal body-associated FliL family protein [Succinivibrio sp.]|nr:flagellar basal body-associated FliL family protein [Succinivibrio sp.]
MSVLLHKYLLTLLTVLCLGLWYPQLALGAGHGEEEETPPEEVEPEIGYYVISPDFTTNLAQADPHDKLHYVRVKVCLMIADSRDEDFVQLMEPFIKDVIVSVLGSKDFSRAADGPGREAIRNECREKLLDLMQEKVGRPIIQDVLFLSYMFQ